MELRPYQLEDARSIALLFRKHQRVAYRLPTGGGKTIVAGKLFSSYLEHHEDATAWFVVHRRELVKQAHRTFTEFGMPCGIVASGFPKHGWHRLQVCSIQTLIRRENVKPPDFIIIDEGHHCTAMTYRKIIHRYPDAKVLLVTATPERADGTGLGDIAETLHQGPDEKALIDGGHLAKPEMFVWNTEIAKVSKITRGEYDLQEQDSAARRTMADAVNAYHLHARGKSTLVFATSVEHSKALADRFSAEGVRARHIDGQTPMSDRDRVLEQLANREIDVVSNCSIVTEGFDCPGVECVILARKTASFGLYRQMVGRVMRPGLGKTVLDLAGNWVHGRPEDDHEWSLSSKRVNKRKLRDKEAYGDSENFWVCPEPCYAATAGPKCHICGKPKPTYVKPPIEVQARLARFEDTPKSTSPTKGAYANKAAIRLAQKIWREERRFIRPEELLPITREVNYRRGWAWNTHKWVVQLVEKEATKERIMQ